MPPAWETEGGKADEEGQGDAPVQRRAEREASVTSSGEIRPAKKGKRSGKKGRREGGCGVRRNRSGVVIGARGKEPPSPGRKPAGFLFCRTGDVDGEGARGLDNVLQSSGVIGGVSGVSERGTEPPTHSLPLVELATRPHQARACRPP